MMHMATSSSLTTTAAATRAQLFNTYHQQLLREFTANIRENINIRLDAVEQIVNLGLPDCFDRFEIQKVIRDEIMVKIEPEIDDKTKVQHKSCTKQINSIKDYRNVARNRLNRNKPKFLGNFVFGEIIFSKLYPHIYQQCNLHKLQSVMIMKIFMTILISIFENHAQFTQTKPQPIITYNTLVNENLFKSGCINLLKHYQIPAQLYQTEKRKSSKKKAKASAASITANKPKEPAKRDKAKMAYQKIVDAMKLINTDQKLMSAAIPEPGHIITGHDTRKNKTYRTMCITPPSIPSPPAINININNNNNNNNNIIGQSYEVEKQTAYFQRKQKQKQQSIKSMKSQPRMNSKMKEDSLTIKVIHIWIIESCDNYYKSIKIFPKELYEQIARYCRIIGILDFICDENELIRLAKCAETAERYQEMTELMSELVKIKTHQFKCYCGHDNTNNNKCGDILSKEQRNLLSVAFKNVVGIQRSSWRTINSELSTLKDEESKKIKLYVCNEYIRVIERELIESCMKILNLLENYLIIKIEDCQKHNGEESLVFYIKMAGDYYRYLAEFADNPLYKEKANFYYTKAFKIAQKVLEPWHPTLLGLALNYAVYLYEIAKEPEKACVIAKDSFDSAIAQLDTLSDDVYKDSTLIMRLLRDNLTLWTSNDE